jgi:hypothetical protein
MGAKTGFLHLVYFWVRVGGGAEDAEAILRGCRQHLAGIPSVLRLEAGKPAGTPRDVVDNSYGVGLLVEFADSAGYDIYETHPDHLTFIAECSPHWSRVQVYDTQL